MDQLLWKREHCALAVPDPFAVESRSQALVKANMEEWDAASISTAHLTCSLYLCFHPEKTWTRQRTDPRPYLQSCDMSTYFCRGYTTSELPVTQSLGVSL